MLLEPIKLYLHVRLRFLALVLHILTIQFLVLDNLSVDSHGVCRGLSCCLRGVVSADHFVDLIELGEVVALALSWVSSHTLTGSFDHPFVISSDGGIIRDLYRPRTTRVFTRNIIKNLRMLPRLRKETELAAVFSAFEVYHLICFLGMRSTLAHIWQL